MIENAKNTNYLFTYHILNSNSFSAAFKNKEKDINEKSISRKNVYHLFVKITCCISSLRLRQMDIFLYLS